MAEKTRTSDPRVELLKQWGFDHVLLSADELARLEAAAQEVVEVPAPAVRERRPVQPEPDARPAAAERKAPARKPAAEPSFHLPAPPPAFEGEREVQLCALRTDEIGECTRCKLAKTRTHIVFGEGNPNARVLFAGEGPGGDEDETGRPFVGRAGQLLTRIIEGGMGLKRHEVYIANVVKCRPPSNRDPEPDEVAACRGFLEKQIDIVDPEVVITLGRHAAHTLLGVDTPISRLRGQFQPWNGRMLMPTFHPSYLLRDPSKKREVWEDVQAVLSFLGLPIPGK